MLLRAVPAWERLHGLPRPFHSVKAHCGHIEKHPPGRGGNLIGVQQ